MGERACVCVCVFKMDGHKNDSNDGLSSGKKRMKIGRLKIRGRGYLNSGKGTSRQRGDKAPMCARLARLRVRVAGNKGFRVVEGDQRALIVRTPKARRPGPSESRVPRRDTGRRARQSSE